jgi:hypothetical protein
MLRSATVIWIAACRKVFDGDCLGIVGGHERAALDLAVDIVRDPQQQQPAGHQQAGDVQQLRRDQRKSDQEHQREADAKRYHLAAVALVQARGQGADDHDIVAGHRQVDEDHLAERQQPRGGEDVGEVEHAGRHDHALSVIASEAKQSSRFWITTSLRSSR